MDITDKKTIKSLNHTFKESFSMIPFNLFFEKQNNEDILAAVRDLNCLGFDVLEKITRRPLYRLTISFKQEDWNFITGFSYADVIEERLALSHNVLSIPLDPSSIEFGYVSYLMSNGGFTAISNPM